MTGPMRPCGHTFPAGVARCPYCAPSAPAGVRSVQPVRRWPGRVVAAVLAVGLIGLGVAAFPRVDRWWDERRATAPDPAATTTSTVVPRPTTVTDEKTGISWTMQGEPVRRSVDTPSGDDSTRREIRIYVATGPDVTQRVVVYDLVNREPTEMLANSNGLPCTVVSDLRTITIDGQTGEGAILRRDATDLTTPITAEAWLVHLAGGGGLIVSTIADGDGPEDAPPVADLAATVDLP